MWFVKTSGEDVFKYRLSLVSFIFALQNAKEGIENYKLVRFTAISRKIMMQTLLEEISWHIKSKRCIFQVDLMDLLRTNYAWPACLSSVIWWLVLWTRRWHWTLNTVSKRMLLTVSHSILVPQLVRCGLDEWIWMDEWMTSCWTACWRCWAGFSV